MELLNSVEFCRQVIINRLIREGVNESKDGRSLHVLTLSELDLELMRYEEGTTMGGMSEMIMDGIICESCGCFIDEGCGYPRNCEECEDEE